jgi:hypothetical protein
MSLQQLILEDYEVTSLLCCTAGAKHTPDLIVSDLCGALRVYYEISIGSNLKGFEDGVHYSELPGFCTSSIFRNSKY